LCCAALCALACFNDEDRRIALIDVDESEQITVAVRADDLLEGDETRPRLIALARVLGGPG